MMPDRESSLPPAITDAVVTVGTFDGVHCGHQHVLARLRTRARELGMAPVVVTFEPHPLEVVSPLDAPRRLTVREEKLLALASYGVEYVAVLPFTAGLSMLSAEEFLRDVLIRRFHMRALLIGHDHGFGRGREGDADVVRGIGARDGFSRSRAINTRCRDTESHSSGITGPYRPRRH